MGSGKLLSSDLMYSSLQTLTDYPEMYLIWSLVLKKGLALSLSDFTLIYAKISLTQKLKVMSSPGPSGASLVSSLGSGTPAGGLLQNRPWAPQSHSELFSASVRKPTRGSVASSGFGARQRKVFGSLRSGLGYEVGLQ